MLHHNRYQAWRSVFTTKKYFLVFLVSLFGLFINVIAESDSVFHQLLHPESELIFCDPSIEVYTYEEVSGTTKNSSTTHRQEKKSWTFLVYVAADNDLRFFATNNIKQMTEVGSTDHINILVHLDIRITGNQKITRRYFVQKGKLIHVNANDPNSASMDSGNPATLISSVQWATQNYPADNIALILWNHGTGIIDPKVRKTFNPADLFVYNPSRNKLELNRSVGILDLLNSQREIRGICWDNSTGNYLTNEKFESALNEINKQCLNGKPLALIGFDACLMSMIEVAKLVKPYAKVMVASQEAELGWGWNYSAVLAPFREKTLDPKQFAIHIVKSYENAYRSVTDDFTQSAIDLEKLNAIDDNINYVAQLFSRGFEKQLNHSLFTAIKTSKSKYNCTHFDEPRYIDLHHFYVNLLYQLPQVSFTADGSYLKHELTNLLTQGKELIEAIAFANTCGKNLSGAKGISIYFPDLPDKTIDSSYARTAFAKKNSWPMFLNQYLILRTTVG